MMSASYYLIVMFDNYVPRQQLSSFSMTRPFLSLWRVWLPRLVISLVNCFAACILFSLCQTQTALYRHVIFRTSDHPCSLWPEVSAVQSRQVIRLGIKLTPGLSCARLLKCNLLNFTCKILFLFAAHRLVTDLLLLLPPLMLPTVLHVFAFGQWVHNIYYKFILNWATRS